MEKNKKLCLVLTFLVTGLIITGGFSCNIVGPHNPTGADTTSNNFTFQTFTFGAGNAGSSDLQDVAIISDTDIWAVGEIYLDSADGAPDPFPYNAVHWDGKKWGLSKIYSYTICGQQDTTTYCLRAIFAYSASDIWFSDGGEVLHWTGSVYRRDCSISSLINGPVNRIWGTPGGALYIVGNGGTIDYSPDRGATWTKVTSGTNLDIHDIWGATDPATGKEEILAVASDLGSSNDRAILSIQGETVREIPDSPINSVLQGVWFAPGKHYYVVGDGIYEKSMLSDSAWADSALEFTQYFTTCVRGNGTNDVFIAGSIGELLHWNGARWMSFRKETGMQYGSFGSVDVKGNLAVAVGENLAPGALNSKGIITMIRR